MSSLVSDFIINPVLRQARRFSRSGPPGGQVDPLTNERTSLNQHHDIAIEDIPEGLNGVDTLEGTNDEQLQSLSDGILTSSPIGEDGGLETELQALENGRSLNGIATFGSSPAPVNSQRMDSLRSEHLAREDIMSDNPSYGVPSRFRTGSPASSQFNASNTNTEGGTISPLEGSLRRSTLELQNGSEIRQRTGSLPADDGMGSLRQQILSIQSMDATSEEKAHLMHRLLTKEYSQSQETFLARHEPRVLSREGMISQERPTTPGSLSSFIWQMNGALESVASNPQYTFHLSPNDLKPTFAPLPPQEPDEDGDIAIKDHEEERSLGCKHYKRNVKLQCSTCERWFTCRLCHDEIEDHVLIRKDTKNMLCMICGCAQGAGEFCVGCGERTAWYYCAVCKLWDNDSNKSIYHCNDCGICRKGRGLGKDFFHCKTCGTCMSMSVEQSHKCIERVSDCDCPICEEYMFTSPSPVVFMLCGHGIHKACYDEHMKSSYKCPICSKSTVNMESQFRNLDRAIDSQPMPPQFRDTKAMVSCNDCYAKSAVTYHWLGLKCAICDSYNTVQLSILSDPSVEIPLVESRETDDAATLPIQVHEEIANDISAGSGPIRNRRHSSHILALPATLNIPGRFSPYPQRIARSASPVRELGFFDEASTPPHLETDESVQEDNLDFWGRDEPRSVSSLENFADDMEEDAGSDEDSAMEDCDEEDGDDDDDDQFELFGHR